MENPDDDGTRVGSADSAGRSGGDSGTGGDSAAPVAPTAERIVQISRLVMAVAYHDFSHEMSEDRRFLERGRREKAVIFGHERGLSDGALADAIWNHFAPGYWQRD